MKCELCNGDGFIEDKDGKLIECPECGGEGVVEDEDDEKEEDD